jgi:hypothetical protein
MQRKDTFDQGEQEGKSKQDLRDLKNAFKEKKYNKEMREKESRIE